MTAATRRISRTTFLGGIMSIEAILGVAAFVVLTLVWAVLPSRLHHKSTER